MSRAIHSIALLLGLVCLSAYAGDPAENAAANRPAHGVWAPYGLEMELNARRETVAAGDEIVLELSITNKSQEPIPIWMRPDDDPDKNGKFASVVALVTSPGGGETRLQRLTDCKPYWHHWLAASTEIHPLPPLDYPRRLLKPGDTHRETIVLNIWRKAGEPSGFPRAPAAEQGVDLATPGKYTVRCEYYHYPADLNQFALAYWLQNPVRENADPQDIRVDSTSVTITVLASDKAAEARPLAETPPSRAEALQSQIQGLLREAEGLRAAGRLQDARQHAEKAIYRIGQLQELQRQERNRGQPQPQEGADDKRLWSKEAGGLVMRLVPGNDAFAVGDDVQVEIQIKNVSDGPVKFCGPRWGGLCGCYYYPSTGFVVQTPQGKDLWLVNNLFCPNNQNVLPPEVTLLPDEVSRQTVTLNKWWDLTGGGRIDTPGIYVVRCRFDPFNFRDVPHHVFGNEPTDWLRLESPSVTLELTSK